MMISWGLRVRFCNQNGQQTEPTSIPACSQKQRGINQYEPKSPKENIDETTPTWFRGRQRRRDCHWHVPPASTSVRRSTSSFFRFHLVSFPDYFWHPVTTMTSNPDFLTFSCRLTHHDSPSFPLVAPDCQSTESRPLVIKNLSTSPSGKQIIIFISILSQEKPVATYRCQGRNNCIFEVKPEGDYTDEIIPKKEYKDIGAITSASWRIPSLDEFEQWLK